MKSLHISMTLLIMLIPGMSNAQRGGKITKQNEINMSTTQINKEVVRKIFEQSMNSNNLKLLEEFISNEFTGISGAKGPTAFAEPVAPLFKALPDMQWKIQSITGEGDKVILHWKWEGTHTRPFQHFKPTGKTVTNDGMGVFILKEGKVISAQVVTDRLGFLQQIEAVPSDLRLLSNNKKTAEQVRFIDKFVVPEKAKKEFLERVGISRNLIKTLPGFVEDHAYESTDTLGNLHFITMAVWESEEAMKKAKEAVLAEYKKHSFDPDEMFKRLNITMDRNIYREVL